MTDLEQTLRRAAARLRELGVPWALLGGWAVSIRTEPRFTRDVDLAIAIRSDQEAEAVVRKLLSCGYAVAALVEQDAMHRLATVRLEPIGSSDGVLLDLLFASSGIEPEICAQADELEILPGLVVPVARVEHLLALKILARDDRTRPQDAGDIRALLALATAAEQAGALAALDLVTRRGFNRGRDLAKAFAKALAER